MYLDSLQVASDKILNSIKYEIKVLAVKLFCLVLRGALGDVICYLPFMWQGLTLHLVSHTDLSFKHDKRCGSDCSLVEPATSSLLPEVQS